MDDHPTNDPRSPRSYYSATKMKPFQPSGASALAPTGLFVQRRLREAAQGVNRPPISLHRGRRQKRTRRLIHKRHELIREARHGAPNADAADIRTSANPAHPAPLSHVAL